jgi:hypothetical protein
VPTASPPATTTSLHPRRGCSMKPRTMPPKPTAQRRAPMASTRTSVRRVASRGTFVSARASAAATIGRLSRKITRQLEMPINQPPSSGPKTVEMPLHAVHVPIAAPRSVPANVFVMTARDAGVRSAPAIPWRPRQTIRTFAVGASAQRSEATPKPVTPSRNMRTGPKMSPRDPPTRMSEPSVSRYASMTHCCAASPPPRSRWIDGSATFTAVASMKTIDEPSIVAISVNRAEAVIGGAIPT